MDTLKKNLEQREKAELIAIIQHMLRQEPDLQWLLATPLPTTSSQKASIDPEVYRQQVLAAMAEGDYQRKRKRGEVQRRLNAIKAIALRVCCTGTVCCGSHHLRGAGVQGHCTL